MKWGKKWKRKVGKHQRWKTGWKRKKSKKKCEQWRKDSKERKVVTVTNENKKKSWLTKNQFKMVKKRRCWHEGSIEISFVNEERMIFEERKKAKKNMVTTDAKGSF